MVQEHVVASSFFFLALLAMPRTARCCLHCEKDFTNKFNYYKKHLWWRSSWAGDLIYCQKFINSWVKDIKESKLTMPEEDLRSIAHEVYSQLDQQYKLSHTGIGYFPKALQRIKRYEVERVNEAIKNSVRTCSERCGMQRIDYIDCTNCETKPVECGNTCSGQRSLSRPMNISAGESRVASDNTALIILPILAAIILFLAALAGLYFCRKRQKNKDSEGKREVSKSGERNSSRKGDSKRRRLKKWKRRKWRKKHEVDYSTN